MFCLVGKQPKLILRHIISILNCITSVKMQNSEHIVLMVVFSD